VGAVDTPPAIFGVPLRLSITYANVPINLFDDEGKAYIYGYVPIVVAKIGVYVEEKGVLIISLLELPLTHCTGRMCEDIFWS
jgi:hypothetical protein